VLWRPYPEPDGGGFWWSGRAGEKGSTALDRQLFQRMAVHHRLNNLIWVWNATLERRQRRSVRRLLPRARYCDILASDVYGPYKQSHHDDLAALAGGKPIALGEVGRVPRLPSSMNSRSGLVHDLGRHAPDEQGRGRPGTVWRSAHPLSRRLVAG